MDYGEIYKIEFIFGPYVTRTGLGKSNFLLWLKKKTVGCREHKNILNEIIVFVSEDIIK